MKVAVMQPYFFPYIGYIQLMYAVDAFVIFDDVQYINRGWINRNRIRGESGPIWLTMPVRKASRSLPINQRFYELSGADCVRYVERCLSTSYAKADYKAESMRLISALLDHGESNVATANTRLLTGLARMLGIECEFMLSSQIEKPGELKGQAKVLDICQRVGATHYVNLPGGKALYDASTFEEAGLSLSFLNTLVAPAVLGGEPQYLSIIDGLMHKGVVGAKAQLTLYELQAG
ncbi:WbqC family protein [Luteimonas sp. 8-5]|uniref:WbqC family protein n=1 Tax=Luteimonas sp. 8-5 TaxID=3039387 RepID=UPI002436AD74|nr:WbqC family protein [Luteimonas sp. 8-5]MDG6347846.1 WbqC family protein [Luteimonas sp. 8-5]